MPNRIIKDSIRTSETLASVSAEAERLFWRLVVTADDYGRFEARPRVVLGQCMTAFVDKVTAEDVERWLDELEAAGLIQRYEHDGRSYLTLTNWSKHQQIRAKKSKFPAPPSNDSHVNASDCNCDQMRADAPDIRNTQHEIRETKNKEIISDQSVDQRDLDHLSDTESQGSTETTERPTDRLDAVEEACREIELRMTARTQRQWTAKAQDYEAIKSLVASGVPVSFITETMDEVLAKNPDKRISAFRYFVPAIEERWALEQAKRTPARPLEAVVSVRDGPRRQDDDRPGRRVRDDVPEEVLAYHERLRARFGAQSEGGHGSGADAVVNAHGLP